MKALISKEDVRTARDALLAKGKPAGPRTIYNHLGRGSLTTVTRLLREVETDTPKPENQPELQEAFRKFWTIATDAGREQADAQIKELNETQLGLMEENDRLQAELFSAQERTGELEKLHSGLTQNLQNAWEAAEKARAVSESHAGKFADALERMERAQTGYASILKTQREHSDRSLGEAENLIQKLQADLASERADYARRLETAQNRIHELEVVLARTEARLESVSQPLLPQKP